MGATEPLLSSDVLETDRSVFVSVRGELDLYTTPQLAGVLDRLVQRGHRQIALDLSELTFIDSSGVLLLVNTAKRLRGVRGTVTVDPASPTVLKVLELTGVGRLLRVRATRPLVG